MASTKEQIAQALISPPLPRPRQDALMGMAKQEFPVLNNSDVGYKYSPGRAPFMMESWMPGMQTSIPGVDRPSEIPTNKMGVEVFDPKARPIDIMGDVASHHLVNSDPNVAAIYQNFQKSLQPWQHDILRNQYDYATNQTDAPETRSFEQWRDVSGLPAYFRGYAFDQWPTEFNDKAYTPEQKQMLDGMMSYLRGK